MTPEDKLREIAERHAKLFFDGSAEITGAQIADAILSAITESIAFDREQDDRLDDPRLFLTVDFVNKQKADYQAEAAKVLNGVIEELVAVRKERDDMTKARDDAVEALHLMQQ